MKRQGISVLGGYLKPLTIGTLLLLSMLVFLLQCTGGGGGGSKPPAATETEPVVEPFRELVNQGITRYLGAYAPRLVKSDQGVDSFLFGRGDGPLCFDGSEYIMALRDAGSENLLIYLQPGGACWSDICHCAEFSLPGIPGVGILDPNTPGNPISSWNTAYLGYCDGSHFVGDVDMDVDGDGEIDRYHRGLKNLSAGLDVTVGAFPQPKKILLAGTSAGGFGALYALPLVRSLYPDALIYLLNDSGIGIMPEGIIAKMLSEWRATDVLPRSCPDCLDKSGFLFNYYSWQLSEDDQLKIGLMSYKRDTVIADHYTSMGAEKFQAALIREIARLEESHPGLIHSFVVDGKLHGLLGNMQTRAGETTVGAWIEQMVTDAPGWKSVSD